MSRPLLGIELRQALRKVAVAWCCHDGIGLLEPSLGKDLITRRAVENRELELEMLTDLFAGAGYRLEPITS